MRGLSLLACCTLPCIVACAVPALPGPGQDLDYANPFVLNELAAASAQRGEVDLAWLLLERAARLAPHDARISTNLDLVRAVRAGKPPPYTTSAAPPARAPPAAPRAPPPIWALP